MALRGRSRWQQVFVPLEAPAAALPAGGSTYLITGGLGRIGLTLAERLARSARGRLVLVDRAALPPRDEWPALLADGEPGEDAGASSAAGQRARVRRILAMEGAGAEVLTIRADVANPSEVARRGGARQSRGSAPFAA